MHGCQIGTKRPVLLAKLDDGNGGPVFLDAGLWMPGRPQLTTCVLAQNLQRESAPPRRKRAISSNGSIKRQGTQIPQTDRQTDRQKLE
jgi:hypothetical protein